ncbi:unnamed protein product [Candidula unifasciata]|uniref:FAM69 protein-kinase domain-containing protein n=1 Tax=Candidula unifasciata TaxID=100452 RepID=A0A8S3YS91_9EUPU|nr:unnamed protein product [Candidula unifasciata]
MNNPVRNRRTDHVNDTVRSGMSRLENVMGDSMLKIRLMPSKVKIIFFLSAAVSLLFYMYLAHWLFQSDPEIHLESLLETDKCPACYGGSACSMFYYKQIEFSGMSKFRTFDVMNTKNVHYGTLKPDGRQVVVKKLASDSELKKMDERLCKDAKREPGCDIARVITRTDMALPLRDGPLVPEIMKKTGAFMFYCPSYRLIDRVSTYFKEYKKKDQTMGSDKMHVLYSALVNPEVLLLQAFPKSEGWPFPEYLGSCGRAVVVENAGRLLADFVDTSFHIRAGIAYELLKIAEKLTTKSDFVLYLTDVSYENFAVDSSGKVTVIDLENIIVVDKLAIQARKPKDWNEPHEGMFSECGGKNCLHIENDNLCTHLNSDHNYNAICRNLLSKYAVEDRMPQGFLHDMPVEAEDYWDLGNLLEECARPRQKEGRWKAKDKLLVALEALKDGRREHLDVLHDKEKKESKHVLEKEVIGD